MTKPNNIKEQSYFIVLSLVIFFFALGKYVFLPIHPPVIFFVSEIIALTGILILLFYADRTLQKLHKTAEGLRGENKALKEDIERLKNNQRGKNSAASTDDSREDTLRKIDDSFRGLPSFKKDTPAFCNKVLSSLGENYEIVTGLFYVYDKQSQKFSVEGNYGIRKDEDVEPFSLNEGLHGEALNDKEPIVLEEVPAEYFSGYSGLGESKPKYIYILPVVNGNGPAGIMEVASFKPLKIKDHWENINAKLTELINGKQQ